MRLQEPPPGPQGQIAEALLNVTEDVPQVPYAGIIEAGDRMVALVDEEQMAPDDYGTQQLGDEELRYMLTETVGVHETFPTPISSKGLRKGLPFAWELVQSGVVRAIAKLSRGEEYPDNSPVPPTDPHDAAEAAGFLTGAENRTFVRGLFAAVRERLAGDVDIQRALPVYRRRMAKIAADFRNVDPSDTAALEERDRLMNEQRGLLMSKVAPAVFEAIGPFAERPGVIGFAGAIVAGVPSDELFRKHGIRPS